MPSETSSAALRIGAIVLAAGQSSRMQGIDKIFHPLAGKPIVWHSLAALQAHPDIGEIVLVTSEASIAQAKTLVSAHGLGKVVCVCEGGARRQDSVRHGLERLGDCDLVIVHDGARPFIGADMLDRGILVAHESGAAIAAVPVKDTIKQSDDNDFVSQTIPRDNLWAVQTPQIFKTALLKEAHERVDAAVTDDASMVEAIGYPVKMFFGSYDNIKVTTPEDLTIAQAIIKLNVQESIE